MSRSAKGSFGSAPTRLAALKNGPGILEHLCYHHGIQPGGTTAGQAVTIEASPCLGLCEQAPTALVDDEAETSIDLEKDSYELGRPHPMCMARCAY